MQTNPYLYFQGIFMHFVGVFFDGFGWFLFDFESKNFVNEKSLQISGTRSLGAPPGPDF